MSGEEDVNYMTGKNKIKIKTVKNKKLYK